MNHAELAQLFRRSSLTDANRPMRLRLKGAGAFLDDVLLVQRAEIHEAFFEGVHGRLGCLCARSDLPPELFLGVPVELQLTTASAALRRFCLIVVAARKGPSDGALTAFELTVRDAFALFERRINSRVFLEQSVPDIARTLLDEHMRRAPSLGLAFDYLMLGLEAQRHPVRAFTMQHNESDAAFLRRLFREAGIAWFFRPVAAKGRDDTPRHQLVLVDDAWQLPQRAAGELRYQRLDGVRAADRIELWAPACRLVAGSVSRSSWDYKTARMDEAQARSMLDQGLLGNELAAALCDARIEIPHAGDSASHFQGLGTRAIERHEFEGRCTEGAGGVRDLACGEWASVRGHPELEALAAEERQYLVLSVQHSIRNNLPTELQRVLQDWPGTHLTAHTHSGADAWPGAAGADRWPGEDETLPHRYRNRFVAVRRGTPVVPAWNPALHFPPTAPVTGVVVGAPGQVVWCDEQGRFKIRFPGLGLSDQARDHAPAQGAGSTGPDTDSAWVRFDFGWAGRGLGASFPLRVGMEVQVDFLGGDPSRPVITGVRHNAANPPPRFSHTGGLPGNRFLSGVVSGEINGPGANQLRFDDTTGQLSAQLASDHGHSQLNLGYLTHPRSDGHGRPRGEGFELRSDESGVIRTAKSLLISAWKRLDAAGTQLDRGEHLALMEDCLALFKSLGDYAAQHQAAAADAAGQSALRDEVQAAPAGSNVEPGATVGGATLSLSAPAGIATTTPKTLMSYAGVNIDCVAQQHLQHTAGQRYSLNAGQGIGLFAHHGGIQAIAHHGKLLLQSQHGGIEANAADHIKWTATSGQIVGMAKEIVLIAEDGSFVKIGGGITLGTQGSIASKAASFPHDGPATMNAELPRFSQAPTSCEEFFVLRRSADSRALANWPYQVVGASDGPRQGRTDAQGHTARIASEHPESVTVEALPNDTDRLLVESGYWDQGDALFLDFCKHPENALDED